MANEHCSALGAESLPPRGGGFPYSQPGNAVGQVAGGLLGGVGFPAGVVSSLYTARRLPEAVLLGTGLTVSLLLSEDLANYDASTKVVKIGVMVGPIVDATSSPDEDVTTGPLVSCTEVVATITMPTTRGLVKIVSVAVPIANMNSLAAGGWAMIRVRRLGTTDTSNMRVILLGADVRNT